MKFSTTTRPSFSSLSSSTGLCRRRARASRRERHSPPPTQHLGHRVVDGARAGSPPSIAAPRERLERRPLHPLTPDPRFRDTAMGYQKRGPRPQHDARLFPDPCLTCRSCEPSICRFTRRRPSPSQAWAAIAAGILRARDLFREKRPQGLGAGLRGRTTNRGFT